MRMFRNRAFGATLVVIALILAACGGSDDDAASGEGVEDGPTITVSSFNFPESTILAEIYAQAMEDAGYPVERSLNLGSRELIFPEIESGNVDFLPEYVGSALQVGFGADAPTSTEDGVSALSDEFENLDMVVLEAAPGEDKNVFVVNGAFAEENGIESVGDLADAGDIVLGGPPECEDRVTCYAGLVETYGLTNLSFESIQEGSARIAALESGEIDVSLLFSTQPVIQQSGFVALDEPEGLIAPENIVPIISAEAVDAYGDELVDLINEISADITTEVLLDLNGRVEIDAQDPDEVATAWLTENGYLEG